MNTSLLLAALLAAPAAAVLPAALTAQAARTAQPDFGGTYTASADGAPASLILSEKSGSVTGVLTTGGTSGTLKGRVENGRITGTLTSGGSSLPVEINRELGVLYLHLGDQELAFKPSGFAAIAAAAGKATANAKPDRAEKFPAEKSAAAAVSASANVPAGWKVCRNPMGVTFRYPASWNLAEVGGFLYLVPPGAEVSAGSIPSELYPVLGNLVPGISRVDDPRLLQMADGLTAQLFPYMRRSGNGEPASIAAGPKGMIVTYDGSNPTTGKPSRLRSYAIMHDGVLMQIQALGDRDKVAARDAVLRQIFASITTGPSEHDPQLVGSWAGGTTSNERVKNDSGGRLRSSGSSESSSTYHLNRDGTLQAQTTTRSSLTLRGSHDLPESQRVDFDSGESRRQQELRGRWYAGNGKVVLVMEDGTGVRGDYQVVGGTLVVRYANGATQQFQRSF